MSSASTPGKRALADTGDDIPSFDHPQDMVNAVISVLQTPEEKTYVSMNYSNEKNLATEVQAYAKIAGANWTFYVKSLAISIGRNTDNQGSSGSNIDIDLGPAKVVSRQHATITYNLDLRCWELKILGRNGAKVDGHKVSMETPPTPLHSGAILDIGGTQMMFILPDSAPSIDKRMSKICLAKYKSSLNKQRKTSPYVYFPPHHTLIGQNNKTYQMLDKGQITHSASAVSASSLQSNLDQDLSKEDAKDIKPPYSYATMITQAILSNDDGVMSLSEIYNWISSHYAYYKYSKTGWQNSIRHNLSLNKAFEKVPRRPNEPGKGMKWQISESYKDEFLNKVQNGSLAKARRGSSVSRQLQLHLATHQSLPEPGRYYQKDSSFKGDHARSNSISDYGHSRNNSLPKIATQPMGFNGSNQMQYFGNNQNPTSNGNGSYMQTRSFNYQPQMMYNIPASNNNIGPLPEMQAAGQKNDLSSPLRQLNDIGNSNTPKLPKVGGGNNLYNLPPPPVSHSMGTSAPQAHHSRQSSFNQVGDITNPNSFSANNQSNDSAHSNQNNSTAQTTATSDLGLGFTSPKKVAPLEAFTPERGSKNLGVNKLGIPVNSTNQSSPAFWNFVQFSTPSGQTPMRKNSDEMNGEGSPTMNRKTLGGNPENNKDASPLKSSVDNSPLKNEENN